MAFRRGVIGSFSAPSEYCSNYADILFGGAQPSTTDYSEQRSFRHYLTCLRHQCNMSKRETFSETVDYHLSLINEAEEMIRVAHRAGVRGQDRDFAEIIDVNRVAVEALVDIRDFVLERLW